MPLGRRYALAQQKPAWRLLPLAFRSGGRCPRRQSALVLSGARAPAAILFLPLARCYDNRVNNPLFSTAGTFGLFDNLISLFFGLECSVQLISLLMHDTFSC